MQIFKPFRAPTIRERMMMELEHAECDRLRVIGELEIMRIGLPYKEATVTMLESRITRLKNELGE